MSDSEERPLNLVYEDENVLVVDKPAGLVCHPTKAGEWSSLIGRVRLHLGIAPGDGNHGGHLVNRLDRETSGLVVVARSAAVARELGALFTGRAVSKQYLAVVEGHVPSDLTLRESIGPAESSPVAIKAQVRADGAEARTEVSVLQRWHHDGAALSLLDVRPHTGRKHQIRIHLAYAGFPIVGDKLYGADELRYLRLVEGALTDADRRALRMPHHALHAVALAWRWRDQDWRFATAWPARFAEVCPFIEYNSSSARSSS